MSSAHDTSWSPTRTTTGRRRAVIAALSLLLASFGATGGGFGDLLKSTVMAQEGDARPPTDGTRTDSPEESRATAFRAVTGPQNEEVSGGALLLSAYAVILLLMLAYVARLGTLQRQNRRDLQDLRVQVQRAPAKAHPTEKS